MAASSQSQSLFYRLLPAEKRSKRIDLREGLNWTENPNAVSHFSVLHFRKAKERGFLRREFYSARIFL
jgi:hypothetical protein